MHKTCKFTQYSIIFSVPDKNDHIGGHTLSRYVISFKQFANKIAFDRATSYNIIQNYE